MEKEQELEWLEAQKIFISEDLVEAAKKQLKFLATVDRHRCLYDGPVLLRAIFRYKTCWLPLLAKHSMSEIQEGPLVVPLDCEWIWHCHRLNPLRYKADCEEFYGRILDNKNVVSTIQGESTTQTEKIWKRLYPEEPFELDLSSISSDDDSVNILTEGSKYDFVSAVKRQSPFFYQVSKPFMNDGLFLEEAAARYKGFLHMIKRNKERSIRRFCVPTYDIDLMWHTHQLHPVSYCKNLVKTLGKVLEHDDMDSDRGKGQKLDVGFSGTTMQWEETFGTRYWRAGGMYRGVAPSPITDIPLLSSIRSKTLVPSTETSQSILQLSKTTVVEVLLEIVGVRNLPEGHKGSLSVFFSKKKPDAFFDERRRLSILSESKEKQVASFQCEPTGELFFELVSQMPSTLRLSRPDKILGTTSITLQNMLDPVSKLSIEKWLELVPSSGNLDSKPICLRIAVSVTTPAPAPHVLHMVRSRPSLRNACFLSLPGGIQLGKSWTSLIDETGNEIINIQMRNSKKAAAGNNGKPKKEVIGIIGWSDETRVLAEFSGTGWSLKGSEWSSQLQKKPIEGGHIFVLSGDQVVQLFPGRKLEYEPKNCQRQKNEQDFITAVEFSTEYPYGKAVALLNLKCGVVKVEEECFALSAITLAIILSDIFRKEGNSVSIANIENLKKVGSNEEAYEHDIEGKKSKETNLENKVVAAKSSVDVAEKGEAGDMINNDATGETMVKGGGCGGGCSGNCGNMVRSGGCGGCGGSGGCGGCGGSGCGNMAKSSGCGSGCGGSGCGNMLKSGGCGGCGGGGCSGSCGNMTKSGGCGGGGCSGSCGNMAKSGGCGGGGCSGSCGNMANSGGCGGGCGGSGGCGNSAVRSN
ncbi:Glycine-rich domain-containing protein [Thalictrum thalictroides]|uniref:Glycine-rich domain-containing protein n=1 Tax=Thalictrum thalictroides TaxID=46969 RepID=A0A7J6VBD9_THATH|nr:Glycine-rich domain-containing protein [Thalictrum thalictroides]